MPQRRAVRTMNVAVEVTITVMVTGSAALASFCVTLVGISKMPVTGRKVRVIKPSRLRVQRDLLFRCRRSRCFPMQFA